MTERRSNQPSTVVVYEIVIDAEAEQSDEQSLKILCEDSKATVAGFSYGGEWVIVGHEDGSVSRFDGKVCWPFFLFSLSLLMLCRENMLDYMRI